MKSKKKYIIGSDEVGRAAKKRRASPHSYIIGIDEVGRGALAGPVVVAAVALPVARMTLVADCPFGKFRDSKKLSPQKRVLWRNWIVRCQKLGYATARVYPRIIDRVNISRAANLAAIRACRRLVMASKGSLGNSKIMLDGGLFLGNKREKKTAVLIGKWLLSAETVIKGDEKIPAIALASIVAKVHRDRIMTRLAAKFSHYGFEIHKGYGTKAHRAAIKKHGRSGAHRLTFISR